jgi:hypothetical protein
VPHQQGSRDGIVCLPGVDHRLDRQRHLQR